MTKKFLLTISLLFVSISSNADIFLGPATVCQVSNAEYIPSVINLSIYSQNVMDPELSDKLLVRYDFPEMPMEGMDFISEFNLKGDLYAGQITNGDFLVLTNLKIDLESKKMELILEDNGKYVFQGTCQ